MFYRQPVHQVMRRSKIHDIKETDTVSKAMQLLDECNISALPVRGAEGRYSGVISKSDIASTRFLRLLKGNRTPESILVLEIMNRNAPIYVMESDMVQEAIAIMHKRHIHRLFVADSDFQLTGVISTSDILRMLMVTS